MRWRFCSRHDKHFIAVPLLVLAVGTLEVLGGGRTIAQVVPAVLVLGIAVPVSVWLMKQLPKRGRRAVSIAIAVVWVVVTLLLLFVLSDPAAFAKILRAMPWPTHGS